MFRNFEHHEQIAGRTAVRPRLPFLRQTKLRSIVDAGRDVDFQLALPALIAFAVAFLARTANHLASAVALRAGAADRKERLLINHFAAAPADRTGYQAVFGLCAFSVAAGAFVETGDLNIRGKTAHRVFKSNLEIVADIFAALCARAPLAGAAKHVGEAEHVAQNIAQVGKSAAVESARRGNALMAEAVISGALLRIAQNAIGFVGFLELVFRRVVARVQIRMELARELLVGAFQRCVLASPLNAEDLVIIAFRYAHFDVGWTATFTIAGRNIRPLKLYPR